MKLTAKMKKSYLEHNGRICPYCHSNSHMDMQNLDCPDGFTLDEDGLHVTAIIVCLDCNRNWKDVYSLTNIIEI